MRARFCRGPKPRCIKGLTVNCNELTFSNVRAASRIGYVCCWLCLLLRRVSMKRRELITLLGGVAALPLAARAQPAHPIPKVGWLKIQGRQHTPGQLKAFREGMKALGLIEGRDFVLEERYADDDEGRLSSLAAELIDSGVAVIVATSQPSIAAAWLITKSVPVIG